MSDPLIETIRREYSTAPLTPAEAARFDARLRSRMERPRRRGVAIAAASCVAAALLVLVWPRTEPQPVDWLTPVLEVSADEELVELPADYEALSLLITPIEEEEIR